VAAVTDAVLARVGCPFPVEPIRTLDANCWTMRPSWRRSSPATIAFARTHRRWDSPSN